MSIVVIGLGLRRESLTLAAMDEMRKAGSVVLRTGECEAAGWLKENGVNYTTFDDMYLSYDDFSLMYDDMAKRLEKMSEAGDVAFGVGDLRDEAVVRLVAAVPARLVPGPSIDGELTAFCEGPVATVAACDIALFNPKPSMGAIVREIDSRIAASEVKIRLMLRYPFDSPAVVASREGLKFTTLDEIDRLEIYDHTVSVCVPGVRDVKKLECCGTDELRGLCAALPNSPVALGGLKRAAGELENIDTDDDDALIAVLGDIALQMGSICESARRRGRFSLDDAITRACQTLINRGCNMVYSQK